MYNYIVFIGDSQPFSETAIEKRMEEYYKLKYSTATVSLIEPYLNSTSEVESSIGGIHV